MNVIQYPFSIPSGSGSGSGSSVVSNYVAFVCSLTGALSIGWMALIMDATRRLATKSNKNKNTHNTAGAGEVSLSLSEWCDTVRTSVLIWFVIDSSTSVWFGFALNVLSNFAFVLIILVPIQLWKQANMKKAY